MSKDVECPYCGQWQEICHDDGYGYEENTFHQQECLHCDKIFVFTTSISFYYDATKADCLNGGEHRYYHLSRYPKFYPGFARCLDCDEEIRCLFPTDTFNPDDYEPQHILYCKETGLPVEGKECSCKCCNSYKVITKKYDWDGNEIVNE